jgi:hypothetical protein
MDATRELIRQLVFFTSILAGFAFSGVIQLLTLKDTWKTTSWVIGCLTIAASIMLIAMFIGSILLYKVESYPTADKIPQRLLALFGRMGLLELCLLLLGLAVFLAGVGLTGWIRSKLVGVVPSVAAILALIVMLWALVELFPA